MNTHAYTIKIMKTGVVYKRLPTPPYQTDIFLIKNKENGIQYEIYAINVNKNYEISEILKVDGDNMESSIGDKEVFNQLSNEIETLLGN